MHAAADRNSGDGPYASSAAFPACSRPPGMTGLLRASLSQTSFAMLPDSLSLFKQDEYLFCIRAILPTTWWLEHGLRRHYSINFAILPLCKPMLCELYAVIMMQRT
jgi:hypothetical protein